MDARELGQQPAHAVNGYTVDASGAFCGEIVRAPGLTKREMLAAMAMQGVMYHADFANCGPEPVAAAAVELADALLAELAKDQP